MTSSEPMAWVCVPTYNERENVEALVGSVRRAMDDAGINGHVLVVDDGSPDGTGAIADNLSKADARVHVLHRATKAGIGPAYIAGFRRALDAGADLILEMDCDFSHDPRDVPRLIDAASQADLVLGSRYVAGGRVANWSALRRLISRGGCIYASSILQVPVRDLTGGFKCFRRQVLEALPLEEVSGQGYGFQVEMTYRAILQGFTVVEIPITFVDRQQGTSKMSGGIVLEAARLVPDLRRRLGRARHP
jgi:dolichol-phosphate mannosyltransferase